jgi:alpha-amylase/alpha-mannosidase (GH57 family)
MSRFICIHGHFYQPPRENPWLEEIELQESAYPDHDWNQRITSECYAPNAASRVLDGENFIIDIVNNYSKISFNFGPTLLSWMERNETETYRSIIDSDKQSIQRFDGHGSAIAQCYNHMIMPLANSRDKRTQVIWGIKDFQYRFHRFPEGMWLPEAAVDLETLDILAEKGIKFSILAPHQACRVKKMGTNDWHDVSGNRIDPRRSYLCNLPSGRKISLFFYDGPLAQDLAFAGLLNDGDNLLNRFYHCFSEDQNEAQLVHIATDGESYGHHHHNGDMALAYCLRKIENEPQLVLINYGSYLEKFPPQYEVEIFNNSSWSCVHGIERWRGDCGCNSGGHSGWNQRWRKPLRNAIDWLRDESINVFMRQTRSYLKDPWDARNNYIEVILNRSSANLITFFRKHGRGLLSRQQITHCLKLLEMQRHAMLMYTSCGWFFDEISGIETKQIMLYASRVIQLINEVENTDIEHKFKLKLEPAKSNIQQYKDAASIYQKIIDTQRVTMKRVAAHYVISSLFNNYASETRIFCYSVKDLHFQKLHNQKNTLIIGKSIVTSDITCEEKNITYAALHFGEHQLFSVISDSDKHNVFYSFRDVLVDTFKKGELLQTIRTMEKYSPGDNYSLEHLFKDEQKKILYKIFDQTLSDIGASLRKVSDHSYPLVQIVKKLDIRLPSSLTNTILVMLNTELMLSISKDKFDFESIEKIVNEIISWDFLIDKDTISYALKKRINDLMKELGHSPTNNILINDILKFLEILKPLDLNIDFWLAQNIYFNISRQIFNQSKNSHNFPKSKFNQWIEPFTRLGFYLKVRIL